MNPAAFLLAAAVFVTAVPRCSAQKMERREYSLTIAIPRRKNGTINKEKSREIGQAVIDLVKDAWKTCGVGGIGRMEYDVQRGVLVISHTVDGHEHVLHLLAALRNLFDRENGVIYVLARPSHIDLEILDQTPPDKALHWTGPALRFFET